MQELSLLYDFNKREVVLIEKRSAKQVDRNVSGGAEGTPLCSWAANLFLDLVFLLWERSAMPGVQAGGQQ